MSPVVDTHAIAARIQPRRRAAFQRYRGYRARLRVPEFALRMSLDDKAPQPTLEVLAAIVREYGVDPSWLIHGEYNTATHHAVLNADERVTPTTLLTLAAAPQPLTPADAYELRLDLPVDLLQDIEPGEPGDPTTLAYRGASLPE